jgi:hypothetical protein
VLRAGLTSTAWITVDDTGARHKAANGFCTQIGNAHFAWFGTTPSKSRSNFLALLHAGHGNYVINAEALAYMRQRALAGPVIARLAEHPHQSFADQVAVVGRLRFLGGGFAGAGGCSAAKTGLGSSCAGVADVPAACGLATSPVRITR